MLRFILSVVLLYAVGLTNGQIGQTVIAVEAEQAITCQGWRMVNELVGKAMQDDLIRLSFGFQHPIPRPFFPDMPYLPY